MALKPSERCRHRKPAQTELNIIPAMSLMIILIPFLLLTAVFGRASILNLYLPTDDSENITREEMKDLIIPRVALTQNGLILGKGKGVLDRIPLKDGQHDFEALSKKLQMLRKNPDYSDNMIILPQANIRYQVLISAMDTCKTFKDEKGKIKPLFPIISIGEYSPTSLSKGAS